jgi:hypothetical protein
LEANISIKFDRESIRAMSECTLITKSKTTKQLVKQLVLTGFKHFVLGGLKHFVLTQLTYQERHSLESGHPRALRQKNSE